MVRTITPIRRLSRSLFFYHSIVSLKSALGGQGHLGAGIFSLVAHILDLSCYNHPECNEKCSTIRHLLERERMFWKREDIARWWDAQPISSSFPRLDSGGVGSVSTSFPVVGVCPLPRPPVDALPMSLLPPSWQREGVQRPSLCRSEPATPVIVCLRRQPPYTEHLSEALQKPRARKLALTYLWSTNV